jgi:hypothetical protein
MSNTDTPRDIQPLSSGRCVFVCVCECVCVRERERERERESKREGEYRSSTSSNTLKADRPPCDRPAVYIIAQQYSTRSIRDIASSFEHRQKSARV